MAALAGFGLPEVLHLSDVTDSYPAAGRCGFLFASREETVALLGR